MMSADRSPVFAGLGLALYASFGRVFDRRLASAMSGLHLGRTEDSIRTAVSTK
jgi:hypothetical protein